MNDEMDVRSMKAATRVLADFFGEVTLDSKSLNPATGYPKRTGGLPAGAKK